MQKTVTALIVFSVMVCVSGCGVVEQGGESLPLSTVDYQDASNTSVDQTTLATIQTQGSTQPATSSKPVIPEPEVPFIYERCPDRRITFEYPPVDLDAIEYIMPQGLMFDSHVTPVDHQYYQNFLEPDRFIDVYAPAAGTITSIQHMNEVISDREGGEVSDYRLIIEHTCTIMSIFIHIDELSERIAAAAPSPGGTVMASVTVEAGELIGRFTENVDYNIVDLDVTLEGLLVPRTYVHSPIGIGEYPEDSVEDLEEKGESDKADTEKSDISNSPQASYPTGFVYDPLKLHMPDPFDYFTDEIREKMISLSLRSTEPYGGKFDYDVAGTLAGNWFQEGTNGYSGVDQDRYWAGHLTAAYDFLDPENIIISIGTFGGVSTQAGVRGNSPNPVDVTVETGVVLYELVSYEYWVGDIRWDRMSFARGIDAISDGRVEYGVVLFELIDGMTLRVETFPGADASEVDGFTEASLIYTR